MDAIQMMLLTITQATVPVRGINYLAALGTILIFIGIFCFRAAFSRQSQKESSHSVPLKNSNKVVLISAGVICFALGILLILKAVKNILNHET